MPTELTKVNFLARTYRSTNIGLLPLFLRLLPSLSPYEHDFLQDQVVS